MKHEVKFHCHAWLTPDDYIPVNVVAIVEDDFASAYDVPSEYRSRVAGRVEAKIVSVTTNEGREVPLSEIAESEIEALEIKAIANR